MPGFRSLLLHHGYLFVFAYVFGVTAGAPIPADPLLLVMGAMARDHYYSLPLSLTSAVFAALIADCIWYEIGRSRGRSVLGLLCRLSLEPDSCVRSTELTYRKRGVLTLLFAKFVPGMSLVSMPLAGASRMSRARFLAADAAGCVAWALSWLLVGYIFRKQVDTVIAWLGLFGRRAGQIALLLIAAYIAVKYVRRRLVLRQLRMNRITPQEVMKLLESGCRMTIVDLRHPAEIEKDGFKIAGALVVTPEDLRSRSHQIPKDQETILYCT